MRETRFYLPKNATLSQSALYASYTAAAFIVSVILVLAIFMTPFIAVIQHDALRAIAMFAILMVAIQILESLPSWQQDHMRFIESQRAKTSSK